MKPYNNFIKSTLILGFILTTLNTVAQGCISGDCENGFGTKKNKFAESKYIGDFKNGQMHGNGTYFYKDGSKYIGEFKYNKFHGSGKRIYSSGATYKGDFTFDSMNGEGSFIWKNGSSYNGGFKNGYRSGNGTYIWENGNSYSGEWRNGKRHGQGILTYSNKTKKKGLWIDSKFVSSDLGCLVDERCIPSHDCCKIMNENNQNFYGNNLKIEVGSKYSKQFEKVFPKYEKRVFYTKKWKICDESEAYYYRVYGKFDDEKGVYPLKDYYMSGVIQWEGTVLNSNHKATYASIAIYHGKCTWYFSNGKVSSEATYIYGVENGTSTRWNKKGKLLSTAIYSNGKIVK